MMKRMLHSKGRKDDDDSSKWEMKDQFLHAKRIWTEVHNKLQKSK